VRGGPGAGLFKPPLAGKRPGAPRQGLCCRHRRGAAQHPPRSAGWQAADPGEAVARLNWEKRGRTLGRRTVRPAYSRPTLPSALRLPSAVPAFSPERPVRERILRGVSSWLHVASSMGASQSAAQQGGSKRRRGLVDLSHVADRDAAEAAVHDLPPTARNLRRVPPVKPPNWGIDLTAGPGVYGGLWEGSGLSAASLAASQAAVAQLPPLEPRARGSARLTGILGRTMRRFFGGVTADDGGDYADCSPVDDEHAHTRRAEDKARRLRKDEGWGARRDDDAVNWTNLADFREDHARRRLAALEATVNSDILAAVQNHPCVCLIPGCQVTVTLWCAVNVVTLLGSIVVNWPAQLSCSNPSCTLSGFLHPFHLGLCMANPGLTGTSPKANTMFDASIMNLVTRLVCSTSSVSFQGA